MTLTDMNKDNNSNSGFLLLVKKEITDNRKAIILGIGALWICCILIGTLLGFNGRGGGESEIFLFALLFMAFGCIAASVTFSNMKNKESRISTLMLPASIFQKFLVRWIAVVPVLFILMFIGYYIGDITRIFAYYLHSLSSDPIPFRGETYMSIQNPWDIVKNTTSYYSFGITFALLISAYFCVQAPFLFGAILWPKLSLIKTIAALWIIQLIIGTFWMILPWGLFSFVQLDTQYVHYLPVSMLIFNTTVALAMYFLTYWRLKRSQVIYKLF